MSPIIRNSFAVISGIVIGSMVNMGLIMISGEVIPPPAGVNVTGMESLKVSIHLFEQKYFLFHLLVHSFSTLVGAYVAATIAISHKMKMALGVGVFFLLGSIAYILMIPSPLWFNVLDLVVAYLPMAWIGGKLRT